MNKADMSMLIEKISKLFNVSISPMLVGTSMIKFYDIGLDNAETQFDMNFTRDGDRLKLMDNYVVENIKGMNDDMQNSIRQEITRGVVNLEGVEKVKERIMKVVDVSQNRARLIARTELNRAENVGHIDGARQSKLDLVKQWDAHIDARTSPVCEYLDGQIKTLNEKFKYQGKEFDAPPAHPNCRSTLRFIQADK